MRVKKSRMAWLLAMLFTLAIFACNFPGIARDVVPGTGTANPAPGLTIVFPTSTQSVTGTNTPLTTSTASPGEEGEDCTFRAAYVADVTYPDDSVLEQEAKFVKTWRIRNSGTCRWEAGTTFAFLTEDKLGEVDSVAVPVTEPGQEIEISVDMQAPGEPGTYRSDWQLKNTAGTRFGGVFYVKIVVAEPGTPEPVDESWTPPQHFIGKTAVDCKQVSFVWEDGTGESAYIISGPTISVTLAAGSTSYVWQSPPTGSSLITLTVKGTEDTERVYLKTKVNVNCGAERPNLTVKKMRFDPEIPVAYLPLTVTLEVENEGSVDSGAFIARWWKVTTLPDSTCEWYANEGLRAGKSVELECQVDPYSSVNDFVIRGEVDSTQAIVESDEIDNTADDTISVIVPSVRFDFVAQAPNATWTAGSPDQTLVWPGEDTDTQGYARWMTGSLENDVFISAMCLETHPRWIKDGWVQGAYVTMLSAGYTVQAGDLFYADVAFLKDAIEGAVTYKVMILPEGGTPRWIAELAHSYGKGVKTIQVDLTPYAGQKAYFVLKVDAGANANYDWACWLKTIIYRYP
jgi:hypothetical protein